MLDVYRELKNRNKKRMSKVLGSVVFVANNFYLLVGFFGYITFITDYSQISSGNILDADYHGAVPVILARCALSLSLLAAIPVVSKPTKDSLVDIIQPGVKKDSTFSHVSLTLICVFS